MSSDEASFLVEEKYIAWIVMDYLKKRHAYEALSSFQLESGLCDSDANDDVKYIQKLVLQGRWDDLLVYLQPLRSVLLQNFDEILFIINKQKYLESLCWQGGGGHRHALVPWKPSKADVLDDDILDSEEMLKLLKSLEKLATKQEFNSLCTCLTLDKLSDHEDYRSWTVSKGRIDTFTSLRSLLHVVLCDDYIPTKSASSPEMLGLPRIIAMSLAYQSTFASTPILPIATWNERDKIISVQGVLDRDLPVPFIVIDTPLEHNLFEDDYVKDTPQIQPSSIQPRNEAKIQSNPSSLRNSFDNIKPGIVSTTGSPNRPSTSKPTAVPLVPRPPVSWTVEIPNSNHGVPPNPPQLPSSRPRSASNPRSLSKHSSTPTVEPSPPKQKSKVPDDLIALKIDAEMPRLNDDQHSLRDQSDEVSVISKMSLDSRQVTSAPLPVRPSTSSIPVPIKNSSKSSDRALLTHHSDNFSLKWHGHEVYRSECPIRCISMLNYNFNGKDIEFAVGSNAKSVHVFNASHTPILGVDCKQVQQFNDVHKGSIYAMDYNQSHQLLATGSNDKAVKIWSLGSSAWSGPFKAHNGTIRTLKFSPASREAPLLVSAGAGDYCTRVWDVDKGNCVSTLHPHDAVIHALMWTDHTTILSGCEAGMITAHDMRSGSVIWKQYLLQGKDVAREHQGICALGRFGSLCVAGCAGGIVALFDPKSGLLIHHEKLHNDDVRSINSFTTTHGDAPSLVTTSFDGTGGIWRLSRPSNNIIEFDNVSLLSGVHTDKVLSSIVSEDGSFVFTTGADGRVALWTNR